MMDFKEWYEDEFGIEYPGHEFEYTTAVIQRVVGSIPKYLDYVVKHKAKEIKCSKCKTPLLSGGEALRIEVAYPPFIFLYCFKCAERLRVELKI